MTRDPPTLSFYLMRVINNIEFTSLDWTGRVAQAQKKTKQQLLLSPEQTANGAAQNSVHVPRCS